MLIRLCLFCCNVREEKERVLCYVKCNYDGISDCFHHKCKCCTDRSDQPDSHLCLEQMRAFLLMRMRIIGQNTASAPGIGGCPAGIFDLYSALTFMVKAVASAIIIILLRNIKPALLFFSSLTFTT